jgi:hypothetical protein
MATEQELLARRLMKAEPYVPIVIGSFEERVSRSLAYSTLYLEDIAEQLGKIATELSALNLNGAKTIPELQEIARALVSKT